MPKYDFETNPEFEFSVKRWMLEAGLSGKPLLLYAWLYRASERGAVKVRIEYAMLKSLLCTNSNDTIKKAIAALENRGLVALEKGDSRGFLHTTFAAVTTPKSGAVTTPKSGAVTAKSGAVGVPLTCENAALYTEQLDITAAAARTCAGAREDGGEAAAEQPASGAAVRVKESKNGGFIAFCPGTHQRPAYERVEVGQAVATCRTCGTSFALDWSQTDQGRADARQAVKERAASLPNSTPCPICGTESRHENGRTYYCEHCDASFSLPR